MTEPSETNRNIVPSVGGKLARYDSALVRRGLDELALRTEEERPRVLIVDDAAEVVEVLGQILTSNGYEVRSSGYGEEVAELARTFQPQVAMLKADMPEGNCVRLGKTLADFLPRTTIVITSWRSSGCCDGLSALARAYNFDCMLPHLMFPVEKGDLMECMKRWVGMALWSPEEKRKARAEAQQRSKEWLAKWANRRPKDPVLDLILYSRTNGRVCPNPQKWSELYEMLPNKRRVGVEWEPALPLILGAWHDTPAELKRRRFAEHLEWARKHDCLEAVAKYLRGLREEDWHCIPVPPDSRILAVVKNRVVWVEVGTVVYEIEESESDTPDEAGCMPTLNTRNVKNIAREYTIDYSNTANYFDGPEPTDEDIPF